MRSLIALSNLLLTAQLVLRWWQSGHFPISNLYESLCFSGLGLHVDAVVGGAQLAVSLGRGFGNTDGLGCIAFASFALPDQLQQASPLVPALRSSWLVMHVSVIMVSYAALMVGSLLSVAVLLTDRGDALELRSSSIGSGAFRRSFFTTEGGVAIQNPELSNCRRLPSAVQNSSTASVIERLPLVFCCSQSGLSVEPSGPMKHGAAGGAGTPRKPGP